MESFIKSIFARLGIGVSAIRWVLVASLGSLVLGAYNLGEYAKASGRTFFQVVAEADYINFVIAFSFGLLSAWLGFSKKGRSLLSDNESQSTALSQLGKLLLASWAITGAALMILIVLFLVIRGSDSIEQLFEPWVWLVLWASSFVTAYKWLK